MGTRINLNTRPMPADFAQVAAELGCEKLGKHYSAGREAVTRWLTEAGVTRIVGSRAKQPPSDFAEHMSETLAKLHERYPGVRKQTFSRWRRELGWVAPKAVSTPAVARKAAAPARAVVPSKRAPTWRANAGAAPLPQADASLAGRAAQHLRALRYTPVYDRGKVIGREHAGTWQVGRRVMTNAHLIALAEGCGFDPLEWRRVAA